MAQLYERIWLMKASWWPPGRSRAASGAGAGGSVGTASRRPWWQQRVKATVLAPAAVFVRTRSLLKCSAPQPSQTASKRPSLDSVIRRTFSDCHSSSVHQAARYPTRNPWSVSSLFGRNHARWCRQYTTRAAANRLQRATGCRHQEIAHSRADPPGPERLADVACLSLRTRRATSCLRSVRTQRARKNCQADRSSCEAAGRGRSCRMALAAWCWQSPHGW